MRDTLKKYNKWMKLMHWLVALMVISMLVIGFLMENFPNEYKRTAYNLHKSFGITLFFLVLLRLVIRLQSKIPPAPRAIPKLEKRAAVTAHYVLYACMIIMPVSGYIMSTAGGYGANWFGIETFPLVPKDKSLSQLANQTHNITSLVFAGLIGLHLLGTAKHHLLDKIPVLQRMT